MSGVFLFACIWFFFVELFRLACLGLVFLLGFGGLCGVVLFCFVFFPS